MVAGILFGTAETFSPIIGRVCFQDSVSVGWTKKCPRQAQNAGGFANAGRALGVERKTLQQRTINRARSHVPMV